MKAMYFLPALLVMTFLGCGGGSEENKSAIVTATGDEFLTGQFIDGPVSGLTYICSSGKSGTTNHKGNYTCKKGDTVIFKLGDVYLGSAPVDSIITPVTLYPDNPEAATNVAQLLQTLDDDGDLASFVIDPTKAALLNESLDITSATFDADANTMLSAPLVDASSAILHLNNSIASLPGTKLPTLTEETTVEVVEPTPVLEPDPIVIEPTPVVNPDPIVLEPDPIVIEPIPVVDPDPIVTEPDPIVGMTYPSSSDAFKLTSPANGSIVFQDHKFVVAIGDQITFNVARVEYWADNHSIHLGSSTQAPFSFTVDTTLLPNGEHTIQAYAYNDNGDNILSQEVSVTSYADSFKNAKEYHIAVNGTPTGDGSINNPWDVDTGLANANGIVQPGDIVWMHGGNYDNASETNNHKTFLMGTQEKPIIVRAYGDGPVDIHIATSSTNYISSAYNWFWGFEPNTKNTNRYNVQGGYERIPGFSLDMPGHSVINCVLSNMGHPAIGAWKNMADGEIYGTIIWGTGHYQTEETGLPTRGSAIYTQNNSDLPRKIRDVISFRSFQNGVKPYTESDKVNNYHIEGTIGFKNNASPIIVSATHNPAQNLKVINNFTYEEEDHKNSFVSLGNGFADTVNNGLIVQDNYFVSMGTASSGPLLIYQWENLTVKNNTIVTRHTTDTTKTPRLFTFMHGNTDTGFNWNNNAYFGARDESISGDNLLNIFTDYSVNFLPNKTLYSLKGWQEYTAAHSRLTTADLDSTFIQNYPTENSTFVRPNLYERGRGHIVIYNWEELDNVLVDISDLGLDEGEIFEVRDVENFYGPAVLTATYSHQNSSILLPMNLIAIAPIVGDMSHMPTDLTHTDKKFATFVVLKK